MPGVTLAAGRGRQLEIAPAHCHDVTGRFQSCSLMNASLITSRYGRNPSVESPAV
jgi:hypothetical protein